MVTLKSIDIQYNNYTNRVMNSIHMNRTNTIDIVTIFNNVIVLNMINITNVIRIINQVVTLRCMCIIRITVLNRITCKINVIKITVVHLINVSMTLLDD